MLAKTLVFIKQTLFSLSPVAAIALNIGLKIVGVVAAGVVMLHVSSSNRKMLRTMGYLPNGLEDETNEEEKTSNDKPKRI